MMGDSLRIQQVLVNLLSNALKFTPSGRVVVRVKVQDAADSRDRKLLCEVADSGPGIAPEDQEKVFGKFVQLANQSASQRGAGLGLAICRDLVGLMGGEIGVSSQPGGGSVFYFTLPLVSAPSGVPALTEPSFGVLALEPALQSARPLRILVAEDTEDNRLLVEHYLRGERIELRFAFTGQEAVDVVQRGEKFDLILMDIDMPVLDGYGASRAICAWEKPRGASTPIVALSADAMSDAVSSSLEAGCVAHVAKPIDRATLLATIQQYARARNTAGPPSDPPRSSKPSMPEQVRALVPQYLASKQKQIEEARRSLESRDFGLIRRFGHNLKGTGTGYGFPVIEQMGRELERAAVEADIDRISGQLDALYRFVSSTGAELSETAS
jgi:CheY-like chemotaxis protein